LIFTCRVLSNEERFPLAKTAQRGRSSCFLKPPGAQKRASPACHRQARNDGRSGMRGAKAASSLPAAGRPPHSKSAGLKPGTTYGHTEKRKIHRAKSARCPRREREQEESQKPHPENRRVRHPSSKEKNRSEDRPLQRQGKMLVEARLSTEKYKSKDGDVKPACGRQVAALQTRHLR